jgi:rubredoxin
LSKQAPIPPEAEAAPPEEFPTYDEDLPTDFCCPKCGYTWSGKPQ